MPTIETQPPTGIPLPHCNIAASLEEMVRRDPHKRAVILPHGRDAQGRVAYTHLTFAQLQEECDRLAHGFQAVGFTPGSRVVVLVPPSLDFVAIAFALIKMGIVPVLIDPGMGILRMVGCIQEVSPLGFIAIPKAHLARILYRSSFTSVKIPITVGRRWCWGGPTLEMLRGHGDGQPFPYFPASANDPAGIFFTTGSTGIPKGVVYTHGMMQAQIKTIKEFYQIREDDVDMPAFPLFVLFSTGFGITAVLPDMDPTKPAQVDPLKIIEAVRDHGVTNTFGSPAIWRRVGEYCEAHQLTLPSIRRILIAGAPVPGRVLRRFRAILPGGDTYTPYGATEALPVTSISGREICEETDALTQQGKGVCVGRALPRVELRIIKILSSPIDLAQQNWNDLTLSQGEIGEIVVRSPYVTREYFARPKETTESKIRDGETIWHRMGDLGYLDEGGRLWFVGRKAHRVVRDGKSLYPVMVEAWFNKLEDVFRSALVGVPCPELGQKAVIILEPLPGRMAALRKRQGEILAYAHEKGLPLDAVLFHPAFPVDIRHNAKIRREILAQWARSYM